jgi:hypothetical protein
MTRKKGKFMNMKNVLIGSSLLASCLMSASAFATTPSNPCTVTRDAPAFSSNTFYVPSGGSGRYNILGWGNGTGGSVSTYGGLLEAAAARCVIVAAAETANSGTGIDVQNAVNAAKTRFASRLRSPLTVCTSGHSQGGGGSFNAANRLGANCVIAVQPDTVFTTSIAGPVSASTKVVCIFTSGDTLAPALPSNAANCRRNTPGEYHQEMGSGTHFAPTSGTGGDPGRFQRHYEGRIHEAS